MNHWSHALPALNSPGTPCVPLFDYRIITVSGKDALTLLQGQLTCDINTVEQGQWVSGAHCNAQGRMISNFIAAKLNEETIGLRVHASIAESALAALQKYAIFSKVTLTVSDLIALAFKTSDIPTQSPFASPINPQEYNHISEGATRLCYAWHKHTEDTEQTAQQEIWQELWITPESELLSHFYNQASEEIEDFTYASNWHYGKINMGLADVQAATQEKHLPQAFNLDTLEGVNFKKGCYTGQEVIARVHYKGRSKQRTHLATAVMPILHKGATVTEGSISSDTIDIGQTVFDSNGKNIGMVIGKVRHTGSELEGSELEGHEPAANDPTHYRLLICTSLFEPDSGNLFLDNQAQQPLQRQLLPYSIAQ